jgi:S1-C subfamily serine protease
MRRHIFAALSLLALAAFATGCGGDDDDSPDASNGTPPTPEVTTAPTGTSGSGGAIASALPDLVDEIAPSVVTIVHQAGEGSGVVWDGEGRIVTNNHVVAGATAIEVILLTGERLPATIVGTDPLTDLAVLQVDRDGLPAAEFREDLPRVGEFAVAIGNPLGFESSVTFGIISGLHRAIPSGGATPALVDLLQTDAAISPGNSGGALVDDTGKVVGINVAFIPPQENAVALGFAIPAATVVDVVDQILEDGTVEHSFLGIEPRPVTPAAAQQLGLAVDSGVFVFGVSPGGPADKAGILPGDVIVGFDDKSVSSVEDLFAALRDTSPGEAVDVTVSRQAAEQTLQVTLQERPAP